MDFISTHQLAFIPLNNPVTARRENVRSAIAQQEKVMQERDVIAEVREGAMWITLNRPSSMNAITPDVILGIGQALDEA